MVDKLTESFVDVFKQSYYHYNTPTPTPVHTDNKCVLVSPISNQPVTFVWNTHNVMETCEPIFGVKMFTNHKVTISNIANVFIKDKNVLENFLETELTNEQYGRCFAMLAHSKLLNYSTDTTSFLNPNTPYFVGRVELLKATAHTRLPIPLIHTVLSNGLPFADFMELTRNSVNNGWLIKISEAFIPKNFDDTNEPLFSSLWSKHFGLHSQQMRS